MANWKYIVLKPAQKYLERLKLEDQIRIIEALDLLLIQPDSLDIKPLKGRSDLRLRVGQYRILFTKEIETKTYVITTIGPRGDIYK